MSQNANYPKEAFELPSIMKILRELARDLYGVQLLEAAHSHISSWIELLLYNVVWLLCVVYKHVLCMKLSKILITYCPYVRQGFVHDQ